MFELGRHARWHLIVVTPIPVVGAGHRRGERCNGRLRWQTMTPVVSIQRDSWVRGVAEGSQWRNCVGALPTETSIGRREIVTVTNVPVPTISVDDALMPRAESRDRYRPRLIAMRLKD